MKTKIELKFKQVLQDNIYDIARKLDTIDDCGILVFKGFHYFSYHTIRHSSLYTEEKQQKPIYFSAYQGKALVGVLKLGHYVRNNYDFWAVNYVDVHKDYRQKGIATFLYERLNEWGKNQNIAILGTMLSKDGEKAKIHDLRRRILKDVKTYDTEQEFHYSLQVLTK